MPQNFKLKVDSDYELYKGDSDYSKTVKGRVNNESDRDKSEKMQIAFSRSHAKGEIAKCSQK